MKLAFSTLGVPGLPIPDVTRLAAAHGWDGVELRAHPEEPLHPGSGPAERAAAVRRFDADGVRILAVAGYVRAASPGPDEPVLTELDALVRLAADLGAPFVRVFPGAGEQPAEESDATAARRLAWVAPLAADLGVRVLLETHDSHPRAQDTARVLGPVGHRNVGALWDVLHTWRNGEPPSVTLPTLAPHLGYVQVKDVVSEHDTAPLTLGAGAVPLAACVRELAAAGWDGWLCWEYEKRWHPEAPDFAGVSAAGREFLRDLLDRSA
ncbi:sugar phosphate isomerase/epimerase [Streptomyces sp. I05A-00742]|uniref:sugar phosphate isomerase/epimerase family protein n=1 Tax=Streptomyces sp. I05A-00742 TaxID=2732853 RepID=UPI001489C63F|nr:sugar phosphate isomerase/epimerase family protein [Streptomyces sp. I05A-00742]